MSRDERLTPGEIVEPPVKLDEPPIVARLVVEIRSDGSRTVARGALEDATSGQRVAMHAEGTSPMSLALELAKSMLRAPFMGRSFTATTARTLARALLGRAKPR